jgi:hypothetical protein
MVRKRVRRVIEEGRCEGGKEVKWEARWDERRARMRRERVVERWLGETRKGKKKKHSSGRRLK